jgi:hypothetical protein
VSQTPIQNFRHSSASSHLSIETFADRVSHVYRETSQINLHRKWLPWHLLLAISGSPLAETASLL